MTEIKGNVKFVEDNGKWLWKRYDGQGSVTYRSPLFDTEREAREHYQNQEGQAPLPNPDDHDPLAPDESQVSPSSQTGGTSDADLSAGTATSDGEHAKPTGDDIQPTDSTTGQATL